MSAPALHRFTRERPCPICGGHDGSARGQGERCFGYLDSTGGYARCTREEWAGELDLNADGTYSHRLAGPCRCGAEHGAPDQRVAEEIRHVIHDVAGRPIAVHARKGSGQGKKVWWERPDGSSGLNGTRPADMVYGLERIARLPAGEAVVVTEGEPAADATRALGYAALGTVTGAGTPEAPKAITRTVAAHLAGRPVHLFPDNDDAGRAHMAANARVLTAAGAEVHLLDWPEAPAKGDAADLVRRLGVDAARERMRELIAAACGDQAGDPEREAPVPPVVRFVRLGEYVASPKGSPDALLGAGDDVLLPVGGLLMAYGDAGAGKTTFDVDAVAHLASGTDWLGIAVPLPVKVVLIQNEGPAEPWRRKLESKLGAWSGPEWRENVLVLDEPHGGFDFRIPEHREAIRELRRGGVDLVVADPTKWLGVEGGGTPAEVREFVALLKECGLHSGDANHALAFWLAHHENKAGAISGAWRADPDTVVHLKGDGKSRTKATWEKCRWSSGRHGELTILAWADGDGYEVIEIPDRPTLGEEEVDALVLAFVVAESAEGRRPGMRKVREAVSTRAERVDEALERLKERGEIRDLDRKGCPHPGTPGTPRLWVPASQAGSDGVRPHGTPSDTLDFGPQDGERAAGEGVPVSRRKEGHPPPDTLDGADATDRCPSCEKRLQRTEPGEPICRCDDDRYAGLFRAEHAPLYGSGEEPS